jgi:hypothetical protein
MNTDRTDLTEPSPPLLVLGEADAAVCRDGFCEVPVTTGTAAE